MAFIRQDPFGLSLSKPLSPSTSSGGTVYTFERQVVRDGRRERWRDISCCKAARARAPLTGALPVGDADRTHLRSVPVFPLVCLHCAGQMRIIAFILDAPTVRKILDHIGEDSRPRPITPARGPPLCDEFDVALAAREDASADAHQEWYPSAPSAPQYQVDQRIDW